MIVRYFTRNLRPILCRHASTSNLVSQPHDKPVQLINDVVTRCNDVLADKSLGRLFAVVALSGKQYKVTDGDIIAIRGIAPYDVGDEIVLEKVLMLGGLNFSLFGRPYISTSCVRVKATVIEKTVSNIEPNFFFVRRKDIRILRFVQDPLNLLRINSITVSPKLQPIQEETKES